MKRRSRFLWTTQLKSGARYTDTLTLRCHHLKAGLTHQVSTLKLSASVVGTFQNKEPCAGLNTLSAYIGQLILGWDTDLLLNF